MQDDRLPSELANLEDRLRGWLPSAGDANRDRILFESGRARGRGEAVVAAGITSSICTAALGMFIGVLLNRPNSTEPSKVSARTAAIVLDPNQDAVLPEEHSRFTYLSLSRSCGKAEMDVSPPRTPLRDAPPLEPPILTPMSRSNVDVETQNF